MLASEALVNMVTQAAFTAPLFLVWFAAVAAGVWILSRSRPAGLCLMAAGGVEILRLAGLIAAIPVPVLLLESGTLGLEGLRWFALLKAGTSIALVVVSHTLFLLAIYGWRVRD